MWSVIKWCSWKVLQHLNMHIDTTLPCEFYNRPTAMCHSYIVKKADHHLFTLLSKNFIVNLKKMLFLLNTSVEIWNWFLSFSTSPERLFFGLFLEKYSIKMSLVCRILYIHHNVSLTGNDLVFIRPIIINDGPFLECIALLNYIVYCAIIVVLDCAIFLTWLCAIQFCLTT